MTHTSLKALGVVSNKVLLLLNFFTTYNILLIDIGKSLVIMHPLQIVSETTDECEEDW